jgi:hypothetical protein
MSPHRTLACAAIGLLSSALLAGQHTRAQQTILFGAADYDEYAPNDRLDEDVRMMKATGITVVRIAESTWGTLEPKSGVAAENGLQELLNAVADRAKSNPAPYGHWYIEGGKELPHARGITCVSYGALEPVRAALLTKIQAETKKTGVGPEALRTSMAKLRPSDLGLQNSADAVLARFQVKLFTEGSGTQIFSTSFAQWAAREALRRAQPLTMLVRFTPRQRQRPMNELLSPGHDPAALDPLGSLIDADLGAYYNWINQQRLPGSEESLFLVWFEDHREAVAISPAIPRGTVSTAATTIPKILSWMV